MGNNRNYFDAANRETNFVNWRWTVGGSPNHPTVQPVAEITQTYAGDGEPVQRVETRRTEELIGGGPNTDITETTTTTLYLYSSVLSANVVELDGNGVKTKGYVYANGERLAKQEVYSSYSAVTWTQANAGTNSWVETGSLPMPTRQEMDPVGAEVGTADPFISDPDPNYLDIKGNEPLYIDGGDPFDYSSGVTLDGLPMSNGQRNNMMRKNGGRTILVDYLSIEWHRDGDGSFNVSIWDTPGFLDLSRLPSQQKAQKRDAISSEKDQADKLIAKNPCRDFIEKVAREAFLRINGGATLDQGAEDWARDNLSAASLMSKVRNAHITVLADHESPRGDAADALEKAQSITFYKGFYFDTIHSDLAINRPSTEPLRRTLTERAQTVIHEGLHLLNNFFTDQLLGEVISHENAKGKTDDEKRKWGSGIIKDALAKACH